MQSALVFTKSIFSSSFLSIPYFPGIGNIYFLLLWILLLFMTEWFNRRKHHALQDFDRIGSSLARWTVYSLIVMIVFYYSNANVNKAFIYFQF
jgi:hypothetical protein